MRSFLGRAQCLHQNTSFYIHKALPDPAERRASVIQKLHVYKIITSFRVKGECAAKLVNTTEFEGVHYKRPRAKLLLIWQDLFALEGLICQQILSMSVKWCVCVCVTSQ